MSDRQDVLVAPARVQWLPQGETAATIATFAQAMLAGTEGGHGASSPTPVVVIADPEGTLEGLGSDLLAAAARNHRIWLVLPQGVSATQVQQQIADVPDDLLDAVVVLADQPPRLAAVALTAWILLRHDAPSGALSGLRDASGQMCNYAVVAGASPAAPPSLSSGQRPSQMLDVEGFLTDLDSQAAREATRLAQESASDYAAVLDQLPTTSQDVAHQMVDQVVQKWDSASAQDLEQALQAIPDDVPPQGSSLTAAMLRASELRAAVDREEGGFGSWWGRRRRLAELRSQFDEAQQSWSEQLQSNITVDARRRFYAGLREVLPARIATAQQEEAARAGQTLEQANRSWLAGALATTTALPDIKVAAVQHSWGSASPQTRRHLLIPADIGRTEPHQEVSLHKVPGLPEPLSLAVVLGLPASSVD